MARGAKIKQRESNLACKTPFIKMMKVRLSIAKIIVKSRPFENKRRHQRGRSIKKDGRRSPSKTT